MDSEFRKKVFADDLFELILETFTLSEKCQATQTTAPFSSGMDLYKKTLSQGFIVNRSQEDLHTFIKRLNLMELPEPQILFPMFCECAILLKKYRDDHFDIYLTTIRHLLESQAGLPVWMEFFKSTYTINSTPHLYESFFTSVRHVLQFMNQDISLEHLIRTLATTDSKSVFDAYSYGQMESKKWLVQELTKVKGQKWGTVFILAGWVGSLARLIFDSAAIEVDKIRSFDIDEKACKLSERLNNPEVLKNWKFKSVCMDISTMKYPTHYFVKRHDGSLCELFDQPDVVINTSCEHIADLSGWWSHIPEGTFVVLQNNNAFHIEDHINCVKSLEEFEKQLPLSQLKFSGTLPLADYNRYMMIGIK